MRSLEHLDRWLAGRIKDWSSRATGGAEGSHLIEIRRDILEDVRQRIEPTGNGKRMFPYNVVSIRFSAPTPDARARTEAAFCSDDALDGDIRALLEEATCPVPAGFEVKIELAEDLTSGYQIQYDRKQRAHVPEEKKKRPAAALTVLQGQSDQPRYAIASDRTNIGRLKEVVGEREGLLRRNHVAFEDTETSVSREHAHLEFDTDAGKFRLCDSSSQRGTAIFRQGRRIEVPKRAAQGVQLQSGDEIHVGNARLLFEILPQ